MRQFPSTFTSAFTTAGAAALLTAALPAQAFHQPYGTGCYTSPSGSFYQLFANAGAASSALTNQSLVQTTIPSGYSAAWGGGTYHPPSASAVNVFATPTDDGEVSFAASHAFASPTGTYPTVRVNSNGLVSWGFGAQTFPGTNSFTPTASGFLNAANGAVWCWHDFNEAEAGSGRIVREEIDVDHDTLLCITWLAVESKATPEVVNRTTMQFQMNLSSGSTTIVWVNVHANATSSLGSAYLVGYSRAGASMDPGSINLATALPVNATVDTTPMTMTASPAPISTAGSGTMIGYAVNNIPLACPFPAAPAYFGVVVVSLGQFPLGTELTSVGIAAPTCRLYVASLDVLVTYVSATPTSLANFFLPPGVAPGIEFYAQPVALICPNTLPNGQNPAGLTVGNGVRSVVNNF